MGMSLSKWDTEVAPSLRRIEILSQAIQREIAALFLRPPWPAKACNELDNAISWANTLLMDLRQAKSDYEAKQVGE